ncbi:MAG: helix-turn-helix domain-containing protein [Caulobacteraceae bacterium]
MAIVTYRRTGAHRMSEAERARLEAMTDDEVTAAAERDPDAQPLDAAALYRLAAVRLAKTARKKTGLSQDRFAVAYGINVARLRDLEQGRKEPDRVLVSLLALIADDPAKVTRVLAAIS